MGILIHVIRHGMKTRLARIDDPAIAPHWRDLQAAGGVPSPFLGWQWCQAIAGNPEAGHVRVIVAEEAGQIVGLLPVEWSRGSGGLRTVGVAGWHWLAPDHLDVVGAPADRPAVAAAVLHHLSASRRCWDLLDLDGLSPDGALAAAASRLRLPRYYPMTPEPVPCPWVDLGLGPEPTAVLPSRNLRQQVSRGTRAGGGLCVVTDPDEVAAALSRLMTLHNARLGATSSVFATPARRHFHALLARTLAVEGLARIYQLGATYREAALLYALVWGRSIHYYSMGLNPQLGRSPGLSVLGAAILSAAAEGFTEFDLLRGDHAFKLRFATGTRSDVRLRVIRPTRRVATAAAQRVWGRVSSADPPAH